jgi:hypothetical protein
LQFSWSGKAFEFNSTGSSYFQIALIIRNRVAFKLDVVKESTNDKIAALDAKTLNITHKDGKMIPVYKGASYKAKSHQL